MTKYKWEIIRGPGRRVYELWRTRKEVLGLEVNTEVEKIGQVDFKNMLFYGWVFNKEKVLEKVVSGYDLMTAKSRLIDYVERQSQST